MKLLLTPSLLAPPSLILASCSPSQDGITSSDGSDEVMPSCDGEQDARINEGGASSEGVKSSFMSRFLLWVRNEQRFTGGAHPMDTWMGSRMAPRGRVSHYQSQ